MAFIKAWEVKSKSGMKLGRAYKLILPKENLPITVRYIGLCSENCDIQKRSFDQSKSRPSKQQVLSLAFEIIFDFQEPISTLVVETRT